jgi:hypothetical protein
MGRGAAMMLAGRAVSEAVVSGGTGTNIGDMTVRGGLAAAFDGTTSQALASCASSQNNINSTACYAGKNYAGGKAITRVLIRGSNNSGYHNASVGTPSTTVQLRGHTSDAGSGSGTLLGSITFTPGAGDESATREITSNDPWTKYAYVWCAMTCASSTADDHVFGEVEFYENTAA